MGDVTATGVRRSRQLRSISAGARGPFTPGAPCGAPPPPSCVRSDTGRRGRGVVVHVNGAAMLCLRRETPRPSYPDLRTSIPERTGDVHTDAHCDSAEARSA